MATVDNIITRIKQRTHNEHTGSSFVTEAELIGLINKSYYELFGILLRHGIGSVPETTYSITANGSTTYALPNDIMAVSGVFHVNNGHRRRLGRHDQRIKPNTSVNAPASTYRTWGYLTDQVMEFNPLPSSDTYEVVYVPLPTAATSTTSTIDGVNGWEEYIVADAAYDVLFKENAPPHMLQACVMKKNELAARIKDEASARDITESWVVADVRRHPNDDMRDSEGYLPGGFRGVYPGSWRY